MVASTARPTLNVGREAQALCDGNGSGAAVSVIGCPAEFGEKFANQVRTGEIGWYEVPEYRRGSSRRPSDERAVVRLPCWPGLT